MNHTGNAMTVNVQHHSQEGASDGVKAFIWHFVQMVLVMNLGMGIYHLIYAAVAGPTGLRAAIQPYPAIGQFLMDLSMVVPMLVFMRYQRASWQRNLEMSGAMIAGPVVFLAALQLGLPRMLPWLPASALQAAAEISMYLGMLADVLYRRDEHAAHAHSGHTHAISCEAEPAGATTAQKTTAA